MKEALISVFKNNPSKEFSLEEIRFDFQDYYELSDYQKEDDPKHPQPRWHHEVRSILAKLVKEGIIKKLRRDCYVYVNRKPLKSQCFLSKYDI